jgi:hypothetical protein
MSQQQLFPLIFMKDIARALAIIADRFGDPINNPSQIVCFFRELGWDLPLNTNLSNSNFEFLSSLQELSAIAGDDNIDVVDITKKIGKILDARHTFVENLEAGISEEFKGAMKKELPYQLIDYALIDYLESKRPEIYGILSALGIIVIQYKRSQSPYRIPYINRAIRWSVLHHIICDPQQFPKYAYGWNEDTYNGLQLLDALECFFRGIRVVTRRLQPASELEALRAITGEPLYISLVSWPDLDVGLEFYRVEKGLNSDTGLVLVPYIIGDAKEEVEVTDYLSLKIDSDIQIAHNIGIEAKSAGGIEVFGISTPTPQNGKASITVSVHPGGGIFMVGDPKGDQLSAESARIKLALVLKDGKSDLSTEIGLYGVHFIYGAGDGDGFVSKILSSKKIDAQFDLIMGLQTGRGIYFQGNGKFDLNFAIHKALGPLLIDSLRLSLLPDKGEVPLALSTTIGAKLGPVNVLVKDLGIIVKFSCSQDGTYSSLEDITIGFKPPTGASLVIDAEGITGGGSLNFDDRNEFYSGGLQLNFEKIGLTAIGFIATKPNFAMLISIGATFTPPIQLSFGFMLCGVGGLIAVNHTVSVDALRAGLRNRTLDSILFPEDAIRDADKIIGDLQAVFPAKEGRYIIGPMVKCTWGSDSLIQMDLCVIVELPQPLRIIILGQIVAIAPGKGDPIIEIHLDVLGVIDFGAKSLAIDATLYDSKILEYALWGDAALRLTWGDNPQFIMSIGGFHPRFAPPANFPVLRRLTLALSKGSELQLTCETYLAITPNSFQFGANCQLYAEAGPAQISGHLGFDTLIYFSPFSFEVDLSAGMSIKIEGKKLAGISVKLNLSGPTPWHARGKAKIEVLFIDATVRFSCTWGRSSAAVLEAVDPLEKFKDALSLRENWGGHLPAGGRTETLRLPQETQAVAILHPAERFEVRQNVVPLGIALSKYGNAPIKGHTQFEITEVGFITTENGEDVEHKLDIELVDGYFSRAQFEDLTDDQKLSFPSFEKMPCGVAVKTDDFEGFIGEFETVDVEYEPVYIGVDDASIPGDEAMKPQPLDWKYAESFIAGSAAAKCPMRTTGHQKFSVSSNDRQHVRIIDEEYCVVQSSNLRQDGLDGDAIRKVFRSHLSAEQAIKEYQKSHRGSKLLVMKKFEIG